MKKLIAGVLLATMVCATASAEPPKTLKVVKSVEVQAPVDKTWATVKDFDSLDKWHPGFAKDVISKGTNNQPGAQRTLTIKDGPSFTEELLAFDEATHSYRYRIVDSPLPITGYVSHMSVKPGRNGGSVVTWTGTFKRKNTAENPPEAESDAGAVKLVTGVYEGGLNNLKKMLGGG
jgi:mxaD protein